MTSSEEPTQELSAAEKLDDEIAKLRAQVESLKRDLQLHTSTLLTAAPVVEALLKNNNNKDPPLPGPVKDALASQGAHKQQCLYRACASVTTFRVRDPDPSAVDGGRVLGVRFEVMSKARFARPYFVMLNRPWASAGAASSSGGDYLRVHRHTVPACIPLAGLAARYLPPPPPPPPPPAPPSHPRRADAENDDGDGDGGVSSSSSPSSQKQAKKQDLPRFVRALRRELVRYQNRAGAIGDLRKAAGLEGKKRRRRRSRSSSSSKEEAHPIANISAADAEARHVRVEWGDGRSGRLVVGDDGEVLRMVVQGAGGGRDREAVRRFLGGAARVEEIGGHL